MSSAICFNLDQFEILSSGNGLKQCSKNLVQAKLRRDDFLKCRLQFVCSLDQSEILSSGNGLKQHSKNSEEI